MVIAGESAMSCPTYDLQEEQSAEISKGSASLKTVRPAKTHEGPVSDTKTLAMIFRWDFEAHASHCWEDHSLWCRIEKAGPNYTVDMRPAVGDLMIQESLLIT